MADSEENIQEIAGTKISELEQAQNVDNSTDFLVLSQYSNAYPDDYKSFKIHPSQLSLEGAKYTAGDHISINSNNVISATYGNATIEEAGLLSSADKTKLDGLNNYTAGSNIQISNENVISATDTTYTAGTNVSISAENVISATDTVYTLPVATDAVLGGVKQGTNVTITNDGTLSATDTTYTAGNNIQISELNVISATDTTYTAGSNVQISAENVISATDTVYTLPPADASTLGGVKIGQGISVTADGTISTSGGGVSSLDDLTDVTISSATSGQVLKYNGSQWVNGTGGGGASALNDLTDVAVTTPTAGQTLVYDTSDSEWKNGAISYSSISGTPTLSTVATSGSYNDLTNKPSIPGDLSDLSDVVITSATSGQILKYDGSQWVNGTGGGGASALDDLTDVDVTTPQNGDTLVYDSANSKWVNGAGGSGSAKQTALTQAQYDALVQAGTVDPTMEYFITDGIPASIMPWTDLTATLTAGQTSLVFSNAVITTSSTIDVYVDDSFYGVNPTAITLATGSVTLTFASQASDMPVKVRVS